MKILTAPVYSFYSPALYKEALRTPLSKAFLYLAYLSGIASLAFFLFLSFQIRPAVKNFIDWAASEMPPLTWTPEGITMNARSPYVMTHPEYGPIAIFDTTRSEIQPEEMGDALIFVTSTTVYTRSAAEGLNIYNITRPPEEIPPEKFVVQINGETLYRMYDAVKPWAAAAMLLVFFPLFYLWKVFEVFFYSVIGLLINLRRTPQLSYGEVLRLAFFAITPATVLQILGFIFPFLSAIPFGMFINLIITTAYLIFAVKKTEEEPLLD